MSQYEEAQAILRKQNRTLASGTSIDTYMADNSVYGGDPSDINAQIIKEQHDDYVTRYLPKLEQLVNTVGSETYATDMGTKTQQLSNKGVQVGLNTVNAQLGRMGLSAVTGDNGTALKKASASAGGYNSGLRAAEDIQNRILTG